jgi:hypothetical protein
VPKRTFPNKHRPKAYDSHAEYGAGSAPVKGLRVPRQKLAIKIELPTDAVRYSHNLTLENSAIFERFQPIRMFGSANTLANGRGSVMGSASQPIYRNAGFLRSIRQQGWRVQTTKGVSRNDLEQLLES